VHKNIIVIIIIIIFIKKTNLACGKLKLQGYVHKLSLKSAVTKIKC